MALWKVKQIQNKPRTDSHLQKLNGINFDESEVEIRFKAQKCRSFIEFNLLQNREPKHFMTH